MSLGKVLIVDDEPDLRELLEHNFKKNDFETLQAGDGLSACRLIGEHRPDLVVLDLMLPDLDGRDVCRMVRGHQDAAVAEIPILMLTALTGVADRVSGLHVGADDYVPKPFSVDEVILRSKRLVAGRKRCVSLGAEAEKARRGQAHMAEMQDVLFHDLKNQLLVVKAFSSRICENGDLLPPEKIRSYAAAIRLSSAHLSSLAEDLLLLRRLESGDIDLCRNRIRAEDLARDVLDLFRGPAEEKEISLATSIDEGLSYLVVNQAVARIILSCLVDNALKYSRTGGTVCISFTSALSGWVAVTVEDNGVGIAEGELDRIFEKFYRASRTATRTAGTGLGLYFAEKLTAAVGGRITCESEPGKGSRFRVEIPV